ncbi:MAG: hypothetical protein AAGB93_23425 [Planctomycetota bacterium]
MAESTWGALGRVDPLALADVRVAAHHAAQPLAAAALRFVPAAPDDSHSNLLWSPERGRFQGRELARGHRTFLEIERLAIGLQDRDGEDVARFDLAGRTLGHAFAALEGALAAAGYDDGGGPLGLPTYELPDSALRRGAAFPTDATPASAELARWYANAASALRGVSTAQLGGVEVRGWPHHFDVAAFLAIDADADPEVARSVNLGFSPGDDAIREPYFYVAPWPVAADRALPPLTGGAAWHLDGFTAAVLRGTEVVAAGEAERQEALACEALAGAVAASLVALGATSPGVER